MQTRVYESVRNSDRGQIADGVVEEWESQKKRDESAMLALRGRLKAKCKTTSPREKTSKTV